MKNDSKSRAIEMAEDQYYRDERARIENIERSILEERRTALKDCPRPFPIVPKSRYEFPDPFIAFLEPIFNPQKGDV